MGTGKVWVAGILAAVTIFGGSSARAADDLVGDPAKGKKVFRLCMACHSVEPGINRVGPTLHNIIGRKAGGVDGFNYSTAHKKSGIVWTRESLNPYLKDPRSYIPGNRMMFVGVRNDRQRTDLIAYLASDEVSPDAPKEEEAGAGVGSEQDQ